MLTLRYNPEDEWHGELQVEARHAAFSGQASAWFNTEALRQFAAQLRAWPPALEEPVQLHGGYFSDSTTSTAPVETHVGIIIARHGEIGRYWAEVVLAEPDDEAMPSSALIRFGVEPGALVHFADALEAILEVGGGATLLAADSPLPR